MSETHFTEKSYFEIPQYRTYTTNHPDKTAHAGTAIVIKNTIKHEELPKYEKEFLQATTIRVQSLSYNLTIAAVYCPPRHSIKKEQFEDFFATLDSKFIVGGDFNSKHTLYGSRLTTPKGKQLVSLAEQKGYSFLSTGSPTYWPTDPKKIPDFLDLFVTNGISSTNMDIIPSFDLSSDHSPIIATFSSFIIYKKHITRQHNRKTDWDKYRTKIEDDLLHRASKHRKI